MQGVDRSEDDGTGLHGAARALRELVGANTGWKQWCSRADYVGWGGASGEGEKVLLLLASSFQSASLVMTASLEYVIRLRSWSALLSIY